MNQEYFNYFIRGTESLFSTFLDEEVTSEEPVSAKWSQSAEYLSMISFSGQIQGTVLLHFPLKTVLNITERFAGMPVDQEDELVCDTAAECINIIVGDAKSKFKNLETPLSLSLPTVMVTQTTSSLRIKECEWYEIHFDSKLGDFTLSIMIKE